MNIVEPFVRQALAEPARPAIVVGAETVTYGTLLVSVRHLAARLVEEGVRQGDRVAVAVGPEGGSIALSLATAYIGALSVATRLPANGALAMLQPLGITHLVHSAAQPVQAQGGALRKAITFEQLLQERPKGPLPALAGVQPDDEWRILLSSGTTGMPKGVAVSHRASLLNMHLQLGHFPLAASDRVLLGMSVNVGFATHQWLRCLHAGAAVVLLADGDANVALDMLYAQQITVLTTTPGLALSLARLGETPAFPFSGRPGALRRIHVGGAQIAPRARQALAERLCPNIYVQYGSSETSGAAVSTAETEKLAPGSAGRLYPWVEAQAVDGEGNVLPPGQVGMLRFRTATLASRYVGEAPPAPAGFHDGWFQSNDRGSVSPQGLLQLAGRVDDMINVLGNKVDPERLERAILQDAAVLDCVVVDVPTGPGQSVLAAAVVAPDGFDQQALLARCAAVHPTFQPGVVVNTDAVPRNPAGKILRAEVRQRLAAALAQDAQQRQGATLH